MNFNHVFSRGGHMGKGNADQNLKRHGVLI